MRTSIIVLATLAVSACAGSAGSTGDAISQAPADGVVSGGEIIAPGDLDAAAAAIATTVQPVGPIATTSPAAPVATAAPTVTTAPRSTATTATTATTGASQTTSGSGGSTATTVRPSTTAAVPVGDGPVLTTPGGVAQSPGDPDRLLPVFFALDAKVSAACTATTRGTVQLRWEVIGAEAVDIAIGTRTQIYRRAMPPSASLAVPLDCGADNRYFVVATNADGTSARSVTVATA